ncbi:hypothetical protein KAS08_02590 [Candidatus Pacearchaeota archaeon]|nr:hypothetical protein [Candidatus Pacearchaeota archaeon]
MVKTTARKIFKVGRMKFMLAGGMSRAGKPYVYAGIKNKAGASVGASTGGKGKEVHVSHNKNNNQIGLKHNLDSGKTTPKLKYKGKKIY